MKIYVNDIEVTAFLGAKLSDILRIYSEDAYKSVAKGEKKIIDSHNHVVSLDGEVSEGNRFYIKEEK